MKRAIIAALVVVPVVGALIWLAWFSPWLAVSQVQVTVGPAPELAGPLTPDEVRAVAGVEPGTPLLRVPTEEISTRVSALPQVESASVTRAWPDTIVIDVVRRQPIALVASSRGYDLVDASGAVVASLPAPDDGVPVVDASEQGLAAALSVAQGLPEDLRRKVTSIEATTRNDVTLVLRDGATVMWGSADEGEMKARVLQTLFQTKARWYDVSAPGVPATSDTPRPQMSPAG